jgi:hypothetical protein
MYETNRDRFSWKAKNFLDEPVLDFLPRVKRDPSILVIGERAHR